MNFQLYKLSTLILLGLGTWDLGFGTFLSSYAQNYDPLHKPNTYRNTDNPQYWKNRLPYEGYWQQDVHYIIKAGIDEKTDIIDGALELTYWNNSPDELTYVFFHLYQNAFQPGSYYDNLQKNNDVNPRYGKYEKQKLGTVIEEISTGRDAITGVSTDLKTELDNTILQEYLPQPLISGDSISFNIKFKTYFDNGGVRRRMKIFQSASGGYKHYDGVHWYPRISVYDRKFGWTTDQHLGKEFYGDFGTYDAELTFANNFVVGATGFLLNREEVLPPDLRKKLDIANFKDKPWNEAPSVIIPYDSTQRKTWIYHAENVHDFAFTADPTYRIGEVEWNGINCIALAREPHASKWQNAAEFTAKVIRVYSEDFGMYVYHKMIVADAEDGMEYPMLTLDGGSDPDYRGLLAHEVGHNWFFGMVGNNETYRAALDEGFTTFLTAWSMIKIDGDEYIRSAPKSKYVQRFKKPEKVRTGHLYYVYISDAARGSNTTLNTHSDGFDGALHHGGGYRQVYFKTANMLYNLQYVLGDQLFLKAMQSYFDRWKICHPYFEDFRNSIIHYTKVDLNWFFDQWLETSKTIDYGIKSVKKKPLSIPPKGGKGEVENNQYIITFTRKGGMQMPIDFEVTAKDGKKYQYHIPNTWFVKETDATVLPKWHGWDKLHPEYEAIVTIPGKIKDVVIDPTQRLSDIYMLDNSKKHPVSVSFDSRIYNAPDWTKKEIFIRPDIWYNGYDGLKLGFHFNGNYLNYHDIMNANIWYNSSLLQNPSQLYELSEKKRFDLASFRLNYRTPLDKFSKNSSLLLSAKILDGLETHSIGFEKTDNSEKNRLYINFKSMARLDSTDLNYLLYPEEWEIAKDPDDIKFNNTLTVGLEHKYSYKAGSGNINLNLRSSSFGSAYDYSKITLTAINKNKLGKINIKTRTFLQFGTGSIASESALYLAGANPEELMNNKYTRSVGFFPEEWAGYSTTTNHFHAGGGLNLRGYAGYLVADDGNKKETRNVYKGNSGAAFNVELEFNDLVRFNPRFLRNTIKLNTYLFGDAGVINYSRPDEDLVFTDVRADAGIGTALTIRFDMPLFLNRIPYGDKDKSYFKFRWIIGINRAF